MSIQSESIQNSVSGVRWVISHRPRAMISMAPRMMGL